MKHDNEEILKMRLMVKTLDKVLDEINSSPFYWFGIYRDDTMSDVAVAVTKAKYSLLKELGE